MASQPLRLVGPDSHSPNPGRRWQVIDRHDALVGWVTEHRGAGYRASTLDRGWTSADQLSLSEALRALEHHLCH